MSDSVRTLQEVKDTFDSITSPQLYDQWADTYNMDHSIMDFKAPESTADVLMKHFTLSPGQVRVLDVACGTGLVAKELSSLGFRQFVGVDGSQAMLEKAKLTKLYQELHLALLGTQPLPMGSGDFDVVTMVGVLYKSMVPVEVIRELCQAAKPGGLVVITRGYYQTPRHLSFTEDVHSEMRRMEEEGLWKQLEVRPVERYIADCHHPGSWFSGAVYIFQKTL